MPTNRFLLAAWRHGFAMALRGGLPCNLDWLRSNYPDELQAWEAGYAEGTAQREAA